MEKRALAGLLSPAHTERYYAEMASLRLEAPGHVKVGDPVRVCLRSANHSSLSTPGGGTTLIAMIYFAGFGCDAAEPQKSDDALYASLLDDSTMLSLATQRCAALTADKAGALRVTATAWIVVGPQNSVQGKVAWNADGTPIIPSAAVWSRRYDLQTTIRVDPSLTAPSIPPQTP